MPVLLSIAGSDNTGGAGIQADIRTADAFGAYAMTAVTAVTVQGLKGVVSMEATANLGAQIAESLAIGVKAVKIGLVSSASQARIIAESLKPLPESVPIVVDTIMNPTAGTDFSATSAEFIEKMKPLLRIATVATPNLHEFEVLFPHKTLTKDVLEDFCSRYHTQAVVVTGVKDGTGLKEVLYADGEVSEFPHPIVDTPNTHGTGCTLSSAIAVHLAAGETKKDAVGKSVSWLLNVLMRNADYKFASGWHGPAYFPYPDNSHI